MKVPLVSVVIVTHSNKGWLKKSIPSLLKQNYPKVEIIVVDNGSLDKAGDLVEKEYPNKVKVVKLRVNQGFGAGCNVGFEKSKGKYVCFANEDMVFDRDYLAKLVEAMESDRLIGASQGTAYYYDNPDKVQSEGLFFNYSGVLTGNDSGKNKVKKGGVSEIFSAVVPFVVKREAFEKVGGFDEDFFLYFEEVDLCWRMRLLGNKVVLVPEAKVLHKGGTSTRKMDLSLVTEYSIRHRIASFIKNLDFPRMVFGLLVQFVVTTVGWFVFLIRRRFGLAFAVCKAWGWNVWYLPNTMLKRKEVQLRRKITDKKLFESVGSVFPMNHLYDLAGLKEDS